MNLLLTSWSAGCRAENEYMNSVGSKPGRRSVTVCVYFFKERNSRVWCILHMFLWKVNIRTFCIWLLPFYYQLHSFGLWFKMKNLGDKRFERFWFHAYLNCVMQRDHLQDKMWCACHDEQSLAVVYQFCIVLLNVSGWFHNLLFTAGQRLCHLSFGWKLTPFSFFSKTNLLIIFWEFSCTTEVVWRQMWIISAFTSTILLLHVISIEIKL